MKKKKWGSWIIVLVILGVIVLSIVLQKNEEKQEKEIWGNASVYTQAGLEIEASNLKRIKKSIEEYKQNSKKMPKEEYDKLIQELVSIKTSIYSLLDKWYLEEKEVLDDLFSWDGAEETDMYIEESEKLKKENIERKEKVDEEYKNITNDLDEITKIEDNS